MIPGVHHKIPAAEYHAHKAVSASLLRLGHLVTPAHWRAAIDAPREETDAMICGTMVHSLILEPDKPLPGTAIEPEMYNAMHRGESVMKPWTYRANECKAWRAAREAEGLKVLSRESIESVLEMGHAVRTRPHVAKYFATGVGEVSLVAREEALGLDIKCRLDWVADGPDIVDVKTSRDVSPGPRGFARLAYENGYGIQIALYLDVWNSLVREDPKTGAVIVAVENKPPHEVVAFRCSPEFIARGREDYTRLMGIYAECSMSGVWPGYGEREFGLELPMWVEAI